jgi:hypothetical protein
MGEEKFVDQIFSTFDVDKGPIKSSSHLSNHIDYLLRYGGSKKYENAATGSCMLFLKDESNDIGAAVFFSDVENWDEMRSFLFDGSRDASEWQIFYTSPSDDFKRDTQVDLLTWEEENLLFDDIIGNWMEFDDCSQDEFFTKSLFFVMHTDEGYPHLHRLVRRDREDKDRVLADLLPKTSRANAKIVHGDSERWRKFTDSVCKDEAIRAYLSEREDTCPACGRPFSQFKRRPVIHHLDYDHECTSESMDCAECRGSEDFDACAKLLTLVCSGCNRKIEYQGFDTKLPDE